MDIQNDLGFSDDEALKLFVGQTYSQIRMHDAMVVDGRRLTNEFTGIAENVLTPTIRRPPHHPQYPPQHHQMPNNAPYIDGNRQPVPPPPNDPNQMEFEFDNSKLSVTIEKKFDSIVNRLNSIDKSIKDLLSSIDEIKNLKSR
jgi:hypothetical protein